MAVALLPVDPSLARLTREVAARLSVRLPAAEILPFGSSAYPGSLSRGDVDLLARAPAAAWALLLAGLDRVASRAQPERWTDTFASFHLQEPEGQIGLQVVLAGSEVDRALTAQQAALADPGLRAAYDRAKSWGAPLGPEGYWRVKDAFWRSRGRAGPTWREPGRPACKVLTEEEWAALQDRGTVVVPVDARDGFVHLSLPEQAEETVSRHFAQRGPLWRLELDADALGPELRFEPSRGGALFPHLYRPLCLEDVCLARPWASTHPEAGAEGAPKGGRGS